jgi:hypothetical protein
MLTDQRDLLTSVRIIGGHNLNQPGFRRLEAVGGGVQIERHHFCATRGHFGLPLGYLGLLLGQGATVGVTSGKRRGGQDA